MRKKILYLHQYYNNPSMPGSQRSYNLSQSMAKDGYEVTVITSYRKEINNQKRITYDGKVKVVWIPVEYSNKFSFFRRIVAFIHFMFAATYEVIFQKADLVYATSTPLTIAIPALVKKFLHGTQFIFEVRDLWPELPIVMGALTQKWQIALARYLERLVYKQSCCIVALSNGMKNGILKQNIDLKKIAVVPNISDTLNFPIANTTKKYRNKKIIYAGAIGHINNIEWICKFAEQLYKFDKEFTVEVYGDGVKNSILEEYSKKQSNNLIFKQPVSKSEIFKQFSESTFSIISFNDIPEMQNNSSNKFFDSLASSTPVVINFGGWINDLVIKFNLGFSFWRKDLETSVKEMVEMHKEKSNYLNQAQKCRHIAEKNFSQHIACNNINKIVDSALKGNFEISSIASGQIND